MSDQPQRRIPIRGCLAAVLLLLLICVVAYRMLIRVGSAGQISF
jgi:hypothetical protein